MRRITIKDWRRMFRAAKSAAPSLRREGREAQRQCLIEIEDDIKRTLSDAAVDAGPRWSGLPREDHIEHVTVSDGWASFRLRFVDHILVLEPQTSGFRRREALPIAELSQVRDVYGQIGDLRERLRAREEQQTKIRRLRERSIESQVREQVRELLPPGLQLELEFDEDSPRFLDATLYRENGWEVSASFYLKDTAPDLSEFVAIARALIEVPIRKGYDLELRSPSDTMSLKQAQRISRSRSVGPPG